MKRFLFFMVLLCICATVQAQWSNAVLDSLTNNSQRDEVIKQSIAVDDHNTIHVVYMRARAAGGWVIYYRNKPDSLAWNPEVMISDSAFAAFSPAIAVHKSSDTPHITYLQDLGQGLEVYLSTGAGGTWATTSITANNTDDESPTIAVDENGFVHLAWIGLNDIGLFKIYYGTNLSGNWDIQELTNSTLGQFGSGAGPFIATTSAGTAHILYRGGGFSNYNIDHAYNAAPGSNSWLYENIITPNNEDFSAVMTIGPDSVLNVAVTGSGGFGFSPDVYYLYQANGLPWSFPELINSNFNGEAYSIFLDTAGFVHISINEISGNIYTGNVFYASDLQGGGGWLVGSLLTTNDIYNASIILDNNNEGYLIAFRGTTFTTQEIVVFGKKDTITSIHNIIKANEFLIYPNPFVEELNIVWKNNNHKEISTILLKDIGGREINFLTKYFNQESIKIKTGNLPAGLYFLQVVTGEKILNYKVVKK